MTALADLRVLDLSTGVAGPFCGKLFADFGADVIKIEPPGQGDVSRHWGPFAHGTPNPEASAVFLSLNTNKRGITLNLEADTARELLHQLLPTADIVIESFAVGTLERLGLDFAALEDVRPGLILTSVTPFGQSGPWQAYQATDLTVQAAAGLSAVNRPAGGEPLREPGFQSDYQGGTCAFLGTMSAVCYRDIQGIGQHVDVSQQEAAALMIAPELTRVAYANRSPGMRIGLLPCKDGYVSLNIRTDQAWHDLWNFFGKPEGASDPRFTTVAARRTRQQELEEAIAPYLQTCTMEELLHGLQPHRILVGMALTMDRLVHNPHLQQRDFFVEATHPVAGKLTYPGAPFKMSQTPWGLRSTAPLLGQHNAEIYLKMLGHSPQELAHWQREGIV